MWSAFFYLAKRAANTAYECMTEPSPPYGSYIHLDGPDTISFLERILTCRVDDLDANERRLGALLTPQGKVIGDFQLTRSENGCRLLVHDTIADQFEKRLKLFRLRAKIDISRSQSKGLQTDPRVRILAGIPVFGEDFETAEVFPTDINLDIRNGLDFSKGCFVGQEVVSRMKRRGKIRKRTLVLTGTGLQKGQVVRTGSKRIGVVTSVHEDIALGLLRTDHLVTAQAAKEQLEVDATPVSVEIPDWLSKELETFSK